MKSRALFLGVLLLVALTMPLGAGGHLVIKVSPAVSFAPANLVVRTTIDADTHNRAVEIVADSGDFYRSSEVPLDGDKAPRTSTFEFRSLPPGVYEVSANLFGEGGELRATVHQQVNVISNGAGAE